MNELKLFGLQKENDFQRYTFEKNEKFKDEFTKFLEVLNFDERNRKSFWKRSIPIGDKDSEDAIIVNPKISYFEDSFFRLTNKNCELELFIGNKKIIMTIRFRREKEKMKLKIKNHLLNSGWRNEIELEVIKKKNSEELKKYVPKKDRYLLVK